MNIKPYLFLLLFCANLSAQKLLTPYEKGNGNRTATYEEMRAFYDELAAENATVKIKKHGLTDSGEELRVILFSSTKDFDLKKPFVLINNGIHPGEPDGIDASMILLRDLAEGKVKIPANINLAVIECYNIGGMLNRGNFSRANQNGPEEYGFRGNARNFDLNRDFIKTDSRNAQSFQEIFQTYDPIYFIDNHVSNGADYQYAHTYITTNRERMGTILGDYQHEIMSPEIKRELLNKKIISVPYVEINGLKPENGYEAFMDSPRYATGYTALFNTMGEVPETHMLKPYHERVMVTYENMLASISFVDSNVKKISQLRTKNLQQYSPGKRYGVQWKLDSAKVKNIEFKGYEAGLKPSRVSGKPRLFYDRNKPYTMQIPFYHAYKPVREITIPRFYIIPQSEWKVLEHLRRNRIRMQELKNDSLISVETYWIDTYDTAKKPYEGHYLHFNTTVESHEEKVRFRKGDFLVPLQQPGVKYLLEILEPEATDSFFNWNFFDSILGRREYYSDYVFEDTAEQLLEHNAELRASFEQMKKSDPKFADDGAAQLDWIYRNSEYFEKSFLRYPVYRIK